MPQHVVIAGNIGTGKSTLTRALATALGVPALLERWEENPFLPLAVRDPLRWGVLSQMTFLVASITAHGQAVRLGGGVQERSIAENVAVFAEELQAAGHLTDDDIALLRTAAARATDALPAPDVVIHLKAPAQVLLERVRARDRQVERAMTREDLERLGARYDDFVAAQRGHVLTVDTSREDVRAPAAVQRIAARVREMACA